MHFKNLPVRSLLFALTMLCCGIFTARATAGFSFQENCNGAVTFTAVPQANSNYYWSFGDTLAGGASNLDSGIVVTHQFNESGNYLVTLQVHGAGNGSTYYQQVFIGPFIQQQLTGPADVCAGLSYNYTLAHDTTGFQYTWLVSNAQVVGSSSGPGAQVLFGTAGSAVVSVIISNGTGCDSILTQNVQVEAIPQLFLPGASKGPGGSNDTGRSSGYCQNYPVWIHALTSVAGNIMWSSGTGVTESAQGVDSMLFVFPAPGNTFVQVSETTAGGCTDTASLSVTVFPQPAVSVDAGNACLGSDNTFVAVPAPGSGTLIYQWNFDDGTTASGISATHTFTNGGTHNAQLIAINQNGCADTVISSVSVDATAGPPVTCAGPVCGGTTVTYTTPPVGGASYHWTITGGTVKAGGGLNDNTVEVTWGNNGVGTVEVYLTGPGIYCQFPTIENVPILGGSETIQGSQLPCLYGTATYSTAFVPGGVYTWTVTGSASIQSGQGTNQIQVYFYGTPVTIQVNISHQILSCSSTASLNVTPLGSFSAYGNQTACTGVISNFNAFPAAAYSWTVQGGTIISGNGTSSINVLWNTAGTYIVTANMPTGFCNTQSQVTVGVVARKTETIQGNYLACVGSTSSYNVSPNESSYAWTVQGGTTTAGTNSNTVLVTWSSPGIDTLMLIYRDDNYCPDTAYYLVAVSTQNIPAFTGDTVTCYNNTLVYTYPGPASSNYTWQTDGGLITGGQNTAAVSVQWVGNQLGTIRLKNTACNTFQQKDIVIRPTPLVDFATKNLTCDGSSVDLNVVQDYTSYNWSNALSTQSIHITTPGNYTVTVSDAFGCTASGTSYLTPLPNKNFSTAYISVTIPPPPIPFSYLYLNAVGIPNPVSYIWNTGNVEATQYAALAGTYSVTMTNQYGCTTSLNATVTQSNDTLYGGGGGSGTPSVILPCPGISPLYTTNNPVCNPVQFTPNVVATYYLWDFQDGVFSSLSNPTHRFVSAGTKTVFLYYSNDGNNWYKCSQDLTINSVMNINFTSTYGCKGAVTLTNTSISALPVSSVLWHLGDGNSSATTPVLNYQYPNTASTYFVSLILNDGVCTDSSQQQVLVNQLNANFTYSGICVDNPALFNDATIHSAPISKYSWDFGNGSTADYYDPVTYYKTAGSYTATLNIIDGDGCTDVSTQNFSVNPFGALAITPGGPTTFCQGSSVQLTLPAGYINYWNNADTSSTITATQGGDYFAWVRSIATGCSGFTDTVQVTENIPPSAFILNPSGATQLCAGGYISLSGAPYTGVTYQWYINGTAGAQTDYLDLWNLTTANSGAYQLVITDGNDCKDTSSALSLVVNPSPAAPVITQNPTGTICSGKALNLSVSGSDLYKWSNGLEGNSIIVYQTGSYNVQAFNIFGCSSTTYSYISFSPSPDLSLFPTGCYQICQNSNITVNGPSGMQSYLWSNGAITPGITLSASGTYSLSVTATDGCSGSSSSFNVDVFNASNIDLGNDTTICAGQSVILNAGAYPTITWQDGSSNQMYTVTDSGEYRVTVVNASGCSSSDSIHVSVRSDSINLGNDTTICVNSKVVLNASANFVSYLWQDGSTGQTYTVTQSGVFNVSATDQFGCSAKDTIVVTVRTDSINLGNDTTICGGNAVQLIVTGSYSSYAWQDGSVGSTYSVTQTGTYKVSATDIYGCTVTDSIQVTVHSDSINLGNDTTICANNTVILNASSNYSSYLWQDGSSNQTYTVTQSGTYDVKATDQYGCTATDTIAVTVRTDTISLGNDTTVCGGNTVQLVVTGSYVSYLWQNGSTSSAFIVTQTGLYYVGAVDAFGCMVSDSIQVTVRTDSINLGNDTTLCNGTGLLLKVSGSYGTYLWQDGSTSPAYLVTSTGIYDVVATDAFGCTATDSISVQIPDDTINLGNDTTICNGNTVLLAVSGNYISYLWQNGSTASTFTVAQTGFYQVKATDSYGCTLTDGIQVTVKTESINLGNDTTLCNNSTLLLQVNNEFVSYLWQDGSVNSFYNVTQTGLYFVSALDSFGCSATDSISVMKDSDMVKLGDDTTVCFHQQVLLSVAGNFASIVWQDGSGGNSFLASMAGTYSVQVIDFYGCKAADSITIFNYPVPRLELPSNLRLCDSAITITPRETFSAYLWNTGSTASAITVSDSGTYYLTVTDMNGCTVSDSAVVGACDTVCTYNPYFVPGAFSPNGDGHNDEFSIYRKNNSADIQSFSMAIFNRWGEKVFETKNETVGWDGNYKGQKAVPGVYTYEIQYTQLYKTNTIIGAVTLMR